MDLSILFQEEKFPELVRKKLVSAPLDYEEQFAFIQKMRFSSTPWEGAGILLPLFFAQEKTKESIPPAQYTFLLNKRSALVQQPGDLCVPGGGIKPADKLLQKILEMAPIPWIKKDAWLLAKQRGKGIYEKILLILSIALRESWEEIRLHPFNIEFLGALPAYRLQSRRWIMFPVVGRVKKAWRPKLSWEVEKIIPIPLAAFFEAANYALYSLEVPEKLKAQGIPDPWEFPCFVYRINGAEEILWGATYMVIRSFFHIIFPFPLPSPNGQRIIRRPLLTNYFSGSQS
jgi:8-oxo-dGTP pyrophosphatase MutT (NUDIX family)